MKKVIIYSDGAAKGNPNGPGGYGAIIQYTDANGVLHEKELSGGYRLTTNNRMELMGVISALEALNQGCQAEVISDSVYVIKAFNEHWIDKWVNTNWMRGRDPVKNVDLWMRLLEAAKPHQIKWTWIKGHAGHPENERCDRLASDAAKANDLPADTGYEEQ